MAEVKFTKTELRDQQGRLAQLKRYLPTLQLKKAMLQAQAQEVRLELLENMRAYERQKEMVLEFQSLLSQYMGIDFAACSKILMVHKHYENVAGVELPIFDGIEFAPLDYHLFDTPAWLDAVVQSVRHLLEKSVRVAIAEEKKKAIEKELREVSIRVNLFEKILIPRAQNNIKRIRVFLGDAELAAVGRAKVAKSKVLYAQNMQEEDKCGLM